MQQSRQVFVDLHPGAQQVFIVALAGRLDGEIIIARGEDDRGVHPPVRRRAQRRLQGIDRNIVGCGDDQLAPRVEHQAGEHFRCRRRIGGWPAGDDLGRKARLWRRKRFRQDMPDILSAFGHPVGGEQVLVLAHHRPGKADRGIDPGRIFCLHQKLRVGTVLAAAIGDAVVDDRDLAVIAQIDPPRDHPKQRIADLQGAAKLGPRLPHPRPKIGLDQAA